MAASFGEEVLRQHLSFDSMGLEEFAATIRSLAPNRRVCILIDGLDQSEPFRMLELLSVIRWLSLRASEPLATVACLDPIYAAGSLLTANRELFEQMETISQWDSMDSQTLAHGYSVKLRGNADVSDYRGLTFAHSFLERFFDLSIALPRLTSAAIGNVLFGEGRPMLETPVRIYPTLSKNQLETILDMATPALEGNIGRVRRFMDEFQVVWRILESSGKVSKGGSEEQLTAEQVAKLLLSLRCWPTLRLDLYRYPKLLSELEAIFIGEHPAVDLSTNPILGRWTSVCGLRDLLRFGVASNDAVVVGDGSDNTEKECPHCSVKLQSRKCPICGYAEEDIRGRLKTLKAREKFSLENVSPEAWLYAGPLA